MACSVRLHKGATLPPPRLHRHMHRLIFLANVWKPFVNPASELGFKPQACGGLPSPGKKGKQRQAAKRYGRPLLVNCPRNPKEYNKLLLSPVFFKPQQSPVTQGSPPVQTRSPKVHVLLGRPAREAAEHPPGETRPRCSWKTFCPLVRISVRSSSASSPVLKQRDHTVTELSKAAPSPALQQRVNYPPYWVSTHLLEECRREIVLFLCRILAFMSHH